MPFRHHLPESYRNHQMPGFVYCATLFSVAALACNAFILVVTPYCVFAESKHL